MNMSDLIWELRHVTRLNDPQLAKLLGCSSPSMSRIRNGKQTPGLKLANEIIKLAKKHKIQVKIEDII